MPQNPLDFLRNLALRNVPQRPTTQGEVENNDLRAEAIQAEQPTTSWKSIGRNALDAITGFAVDDPMSVNPSDGWGKKFGALAATAPMLPKSRLPIIAPEAYKDVKAGGLRLYSRLTDAFTKAPGMMPPAKVQAIAKQSTAAEEIDVRKLGDLLANRKPMDKIDRREVMGHLEKNPIELDVSRKGKPDSSANVPFSAREQANQELGMMQHDFDTRYGQGWEWEPDDINPIPAETRPPGPTAEERARFADLESRADAADGPPPSELAQYDWLQTPGEAENYGESLMKMPPHPEVKRLEAETSRLQQERDTFLEARGMSKMGYDDTYRPVDFDTVDEWNEYAQNIEQYGKARNERLDADKQYNFRSSHFQDDPNTLVWSRHNDRRLAPNEEQMTDHEFRVASTNRDLDEMRRVPVEDPNFNEAFTLSEAARKQRHDNSRSLFPKGQKGRFVEEIQSDWHQQGREKGYKLDKLPEEWGVQESTSRYPYEVQLPKNEVAFGVSPPDAEKNALALYNSDKVPDAPYKDTYHELALKQQLLDTANDPSLEWLGVADSQTVANMEGHDSVKDGMRLNYDEKHPAALRKLLSPLGGKVEYDNLPGYPIRPGELFAGSTGMPLGYPHAEDPIGIFTKSGTQKAEQVASAIPRQADFNQIDALKAQIAQPGRTMPGPGMWKANLSPELKQLIKERGFPAMAALLALQSQRDRFNGEQ